MCLPYFWVWAAARGLGVLLQCCSCDEIVCWLRKEYSTRTFFRVYPNRIEFNVPRMRIPFGLLGCGEYGEMVSRCRIVLKDLGKKKK
jgi:hypothetical protein